MTRGPIEIRKATRRLLLIGALSAVGTASATTRALADAPAEPVLAEVRIEGNSSIGDEKIRAKIVSKAGRPLNRATVDSDLRALLSTKWFTDVNTKVAQTSDGKGYVLTFVVKEMPILTSVEFIGRKGVRLKDIEDATELRKGARADAVRAQLARRQILQLYLDKGYEKAEVTLLEGGRPGDTKVVISIYEGPKFEVGKVDFVGNTFVSDAVLRTKVASRAPIAFGLGGNYSKETFEEDAAKLRDYYQNNGFLAVQVRPSVRPGASLGRRDVTFVIEEGKRFRVREIVFEGNKKLATAELKPGLKLHSGEFYSDSVRTADRMALQSKYFGVGCIDASIAVEPRYTERNDVLDLVYKIEEGDVYKIGQIIVRGNEHTMDKVVRREADMAGLLPGELLDLNRIDTFRNRLNNTGYFNVPAQGSAPTKPLEIKVINRRPLDKPYGDIQTFDLGGPALTRMQNPDDEPPPIPEGPRIEEPAPSRGPSQLTPFGGGLFSPPPDTLPPIAVPAAPDVPRTLPSARPLDGRPPRRPLGAGEPPGTLPSLPYTNRDDVGPDRNEPFANRAPSAYADVIADVEEAPTGRFMAGIGASSFGGLNASLILQETNFDIFAVPRSLDDIREGRAFRGRGQQFRLELSPGTLINRYIVSFNDPYLFDLPINLGTSGYQYSRLYEDWTERRGGGRFSLGKQFGPSVYADVAFRIENVNLSGFNYPAPAEVLAASGNTTLASIRPSIRRDTRNNPFTPTSGSYAEAAFEQGWGTFTFPKLTLEGRRHFTTGSRPDGSGKRILSVRGFFGVSGQDTPVYERFFAGDFRSMRGFAYRGVGPHVLNTNIGGLITSIGSVEYQFPWTANDQFHQVVFADFGTVNLDYNFNGYRLAVGTGVRVLIPQLFKQMPLAFDLAFPIVKADGDQTRYFTFFIGGFW